MPAMVFTAAIIDCILGLMLLGRSVGEISSIGDDEVKLVKLLFDHKGYNRLIRPVADLNQTVQVDFGLAMIQLINVEEKAQILKSNVWLRMTWNDYQLRWDPADFGGIQVIRLNPDKVWRPDIVLYNNADGRYEVSWQPNALIFSTGMVLWIPPAIYQSSCTIHVRYFPFDQQECEMKFGSWTFDATQVVLGLYENSRVVDLNDYWRSGSWDIIDCPGNISIIEKANQPPQTMIIYKLSIRRKTLFYTVNLIIPCVLISFLSVCVFYLPADAGEKMTLCISILLALVVFLLLVSKMLPPTSISIPLISKFLLFTFIMNIFTIVFTVVIINWNFRTPRTHKMPRWVRRLFLKFLPRLLLMKRPEHIDKEEQRELSMDKLGEGRVGGGGGGGRPGRLRGAVGVCDTDDADKTESSLGDEEETTELEEAGEEADGDSDAEADGTSGRRRRRRRGLTAVEVTPELRRAIAAINFISTHLRVEDEYKRVLQDWKYVASVIDRIQLVIFTSVTLTGTIAILLNAPFILEFVDQGAIIGKLIDAQKADS